MPAHSASEDARKRADVAGIHVFRAEKQDVDGRDKPGHDDGNDSKRSERALTKKNSSERLAAAAQIKTISRAWRRRYRSATGRAHTLTGTRCCRDSQSIAAHWR